MILHKQISPPDANGRLEWLTVDADTLTVAHCTVGKASKIRIEILRPLRSPVAASSHSVSFDLGETAIAILCACRESFGNLASTPADVALIPEDQIELPEYILLYQTSSIMPAIMHTRDPIFIATDPWELEDSCEAPDYYRSAVDLPPSGWKYWCTDAYQEFQRLSEELYSPRIGHTQAREARQAVR